MSRLKHVNTMLWLVMVTALGLVIAGSAAARVVTVDLTRRDVQAHRPSDTTLGNYYTFSVPVPEKLLEETLMDATLELVVEGAARVDDLAQGGVITLEVFALKSALTDELTTADLRAGATKHTVRTGEARRVRINISEHVRYLLEQPGANHGLVVGSLTGQRLGKFTLRHDTLGQGVIARLTIVFAELGQHLPGER